MVSRRASLDQLVHGIRQTDSRARALQQAAHKPHHRRTDPRGRSGDPPSCPTERNGNGGHHEHRSGRPLYLVHRDFYGACFPDRKLGARRLTRFLAVHGTTELITMASLGLIFLIGLLAHKFNFSWALGGFLAGAIFSRSHLAQKIELLTEPLRDMFSAMFFVTVGMLIDPKALISNAPIILGLSVVVIFCKFSSCWLGFFLAGRSPRDASRAALIKSQISEFSFVIVAIGATHGATSTKTSSQSFPVWPS